MRSFPLLVLFIALACMAGCIQGERSQNHDAGAGTGLYTTTVQPSPSLNISLTPETPVPTTPVVSLGAKRTFSFTSGGKNYSFPVSVPILSDPGSGGAPTCPLMSWRTGEEQLLASYYTGIFEDPREAPVYDALLGELRHIRRMEVFNDDEYLELLTHFVQQIPYDPAAPVCPRRPDQVLLDGKGDCDEKSLLLLGLFDREGYDAAILLFPTEHHATAGIRILVEGQPSFRVYDLKGRKYVYIETTKPSFIGLYPDEFANKTPIIIPTGNGTIMYRAINDVMHIVATQKRMEEKMTWLATTGEEMLTEIQALEQKLSSGTGYDTQDEYDSDYARYTSLVATYNSYVKDFQAIREVYQFILDHQSDRQGVSGRIANSKVENLL